MQNKKTQPVKTVLTIVVGFVIVYMATHYKWALWTALITGAAGLSSTYLSEKIDWVWMKLTHILSLIVPNIMLSLVFFVFLFPIAILSRLMGKKDPMMLKAGYKTTFMTVDKSFEKSGFEKSW